MSLIIEKNKCEDRFQDIDEKINELDILKENLGNKYSILSLLIKNNKKRSSLKTVDTVLKKVDFSKYNYINVKKFDEANKSFSEISDFDLENDDEEKKSDFNSSDEDEDIEFEEEKIIFKSKFIKEKKFDDEFDMQLEKEYEDILKIIKTKN